MRLQNQVAIITGAARGMGQAFCLALAKEGAKIIAADLLACQETIAKVQKSGERLLKLPAIFLRPKVPKLWRSKAFSDLAVLIY